MIRFFITTFVFISVAAMSKASMPQWTIDTLSSVSDTIDTSIDYSTDSLTRATADESYRQLQLLRAENASEANLYPLVYQCYTDNVAALAISEEGTPEYQKCKSV